MRLIIHLLPIVALLCNSAGAAPVYQWVDAEGVTHFSETPPVAADTDVTQLQLETQPPPAPAADDDYYSIANQAERMEQRRLAAQEARTRELQARAEADRARAAALAAQSIPAPDTADPQEAATVYLPAWGHRPYPGRHHGWYGQSRHRPRRLPDYGTQPWPIQSLRPPGPRPYRAR